MKKNILITGASQRIGKIICEKLAESGCNIIIHFNKSKKKASVLNNSLKKFGVKTAFIKADLSKEKETKSLFYKAKKILGSINCLINNASTFEFDSIDNINKKKWDYHLNVNVWSPIILIKEFKKNLPKNVTGNVINIIAMALAPKIRVNAIGPGPTLASKRQTKSKFKKQYKSMPLKKKVDPEEIANAVKFIMNNQSITGQLITVDSGQHLGWAHNKKNNLDE